MQKEISKIELADAYEIPRVIVGCWQLAGGHGKIDASLAVDNLFKFYQEGLNTFDIADIYTGVEELFGEFFKKYNGKFDPERPVLIHTKFVPDLHMLPSLTEQQIEAVIDRSLKRIGVEQLDLVQYHWWDYSVPGYVESALILKKLQQKGKIKNLGTTNFDAEHLEEMIAQGVTFVSNQIQYSVIDKRPEYQIIPALKRHNMKAICYGTIAGGLLSERYLEVPKPLQPYENRSLTKYMLILEEYFENWDKFQDFLHTLKKIANKYSVDIATIASAYILSKEQVAAVVIGARNTHHISEMKQLLRFSLDDDDQTKIQRLISQVKNPKNKKVYGFERDMSSQHAKIMKFNLQVV